MDLPVMPPVAPMLAKAVKDLPEGDLVYEPKWDGFRCIVFRDGDEVELGSRNERPLTRYFPDVAGAARDELPPRCVLDGEIVIAGPSGLDFDALSQRIHPAESRVRMLARTTPASFVAFDVLALDERDLRGEPFLARREALVAALAPARPPVHVTPATRDRDVAAGWFSRFEGAGLDGVVAKAVDLPYLEDKRVMAKVKHERTAEFVVMGFRWFRSGTEGESIGSLLLGLYDGDQLVHVGVIGAFSASERKQLVDFLSPYRRGAPESLPGPPSRWNAAKDLTFESLRPELVVEAAFEHLQGRRLRHTARFRRWRPDRDPRSATFEQLDVAVPAELAEVFSARG